MYTSDIYSLACQGNQFQNDGIQNLISPIILVQNLKTVKTTLTTNKSSQFSSKL